MSIMKGLSSETLYFENELEGILKSIRQRQPRSGRAIFLLDQTGFSQVELALVCPYLQRTTSSRGHTDICRRCPCQPSGADATNSQDRRATAIDGLADTRPDPTQEWRRWQSARSKDTSRPRSNRNRGLVRHPFLYSPRNLATRLMVSPSVKAPDGSRRHDSAALEYPQYV